MSARVHPLPIFVEESHQVPIVEIVFGTRGGGASDAIGREGALNLAYRSLRRGAGNRSAVAIEQEIDRLGSTFGAAVDVHGTNVHGRVIRRNLERFLPLLADLVLRPRFPAQEVGQLVREIRADVVAARNDDRGLASRAFRRALFAGSPKGRPVAGILDSIDTLDRDIAESAYREQFVRGNLAIGVSGDITPTEATAMVSEWFGGIPDGPSAARDAEEPMRPDGRHLLIVDKPDRTQTQIFIGTIGGDPFDADFVALEVANVVFGGTFTARLMQEVRSKRGWSYGASSRFGFDRGREGWSMHTFPAATDAAECIALQLSLLEQWIDRGITQRELEFAKRYISGSHAFEVETPAKRLRQRLDTELMPVPKGYFERYVERVNAVTLDQANRALRKRVNVDDLLITIVATAKDLQPALEKAIPRLASTQVLPFDRDAIHRKPIFPMRAGADTKLKAARGRRESHASGS